MDTEEFQRGITIPVIQSGCLFVLAGGLMLAVALWKGWGDEWEMALGAGSFLSGAWLISRFLVYWDVYLRQWREPIYETTTVEPAQEARRVVLTLRSQDGRRQELIDLPIDYRKLERFAEGVVVHGLAISEESLTGNGKISGRTSGTS